MIRVERQYDAKRLNEICNHPDIYRWVHGNIGTPLDFSPVVNKESPHINLIGAHGGMLFQLHQQGLYEAHTHVLPEARGEWTAGMVVEALHYMFTHTDAVELWTKVPKGNIAARALVKMFGWTFQFRAPHSWIMKGEKVYADIFSTQIQDWIRTAPHLTEWGVWFHNKLDEEYRRLGAPGIQHEDSEIYNRHIGASIEMIRHGQPVKGMIFYNRWARMANYQTLQVMSLDPIMLNIGEAIIELQGSNFFVAALNKYTH